MRPRQQQTMRHPGNSMMTTPLTHRVLSVLDYPFPSQYRNNIRVVLDHGDVSPSTNQECVK
jgi:hypothetical protein